MSDQDAKYSGLVEIVKRNGEFSKNYGRNRGALLSAWMGHLATRKAPVIRPGWIIALAGVVFSAWKYWPW